LDHPTNKQGMLGDPERVTMTTPKHRVVVIGGGFGGLKTVTSLKRSPVDITLVDKRNFHLFQPLLYQVATGGLSPANIAAPLRSLVRHQANCSVILGESTQIDVKAREVIVGNDRIPYDSLVIAAGVRHSYFGNDDWEHFAPGLKSIEDATSIRRRILSAFEEAERTNSHEQRKPLLTFVVIGGGPTGVELAGTLVEIARHTLRRDFRKINSVDARVLLVEAGERVLPQFEPDLSEKARKSLEWLGVEVQLRTRVVDVGEGYVQLESPSGVTRIETKTTLWAAGVQGAALGRVVADATGAKTDRAGRIVVQRDFTITGHPEIFVIGDLALNRQPDGSPLPGIAPAAMQAGKFVAKLIDSRVRGRPLPQFAYRDRGIMATIGRAAAVARIGRWKTSGLIAWLLWLFVHLTFLVQFQNRLLVLTQWAWNYFSYNRSARLITETPDGRKSE
jgi:NADH:ubiquinone reductase (H+-translocating)